MHGCFLIRHKRVLLVYPVKWKMSPKWPENIIIIRWVCRWKIKWLVARWWMRKDRYSVFPRSPPELIRWLLAMQQGPLLPWHKKSMRFLWVMLRWKVSESGKDCPKWKIRHWFTCLWLLHKWRMKSTANYWMILSASSRTARTGIFAVPIIM